MINFSRKKRKKSKIISATNQKTFIIKKLTEKSKLSVQIAKVSRQKTETTDQKIHNFQLRKTGEKRKARMTTIDFISIRGQQNFEDNAEINLIEIKIENDKIQNMLEKCKKNSFKFSFEGLLFLRAIKNETEKIFVTVGGLMDAKYSLINEKLYQTIGIINFNKIKNWNKTKRSSLWVNVNFQVQGDNRDSKHFSHNFITKNTRDVLNFTLKLIDDENEEIKFEDKEKKIQILNFLLEFLA